MGILYVDLIQGVMVRGRLTHRVFPKDVESIHVDMEKERAFIKLKEGKLTVFGPGLAGVCEEFTPAKAETKKASKAE